jgi:hypothetical protein
VAAGGPCDERADALVFDDLPLTQIWPPSGRSERPHFVSPWIIDSVANETLARVVDDRPDGTGAGIVSL